MKLCPVCQREYPEGATNCADDGVPLVAMGRDVHGRSEDLVGQIVEGRWKIERIIGKGGMGTVYACRHVVVGKVAAIKVLRTGADRSEAVLQRFVREAQTTNLIKSRHIVEVSDFGQLPNGALFVVMELLEGHDLSRAMRAGLGRKELVHVFTQVAETLQTAHEKGVVHRDLKPDNVFLVTEGGDPLFVKLLDFGIAKMLHGEGTGALTETGVILGTPYYMSPEQARAESVDHRTDIYALGVMMYRAFTGRLPFMADSTVGVLTRHITEAPQPPSEISNVDTTTERMILRCLAKKPEYRFQSMREVADALRLVPLGPGAPAQASFVATPSPGPMPAMTSGAHAPGASSAYAAMMPTSLATPAPTGAHTPAPSIASGLPSAPVPTPASNPHLAAMSGSYPAAQAHVASVPPGYAGITGASPALASVPAEPTTRGVAATAAPPARNSNALLLVVGGLATAAIGGVAALVIFGRGPAAGAAARPPPPVAVAPPPVAAATASTTAAASAATTTATPAPTAAAPAAPSATASASTAPAATVAPAHLHRMAPPPPTAAATAAPAGPKLPHDVRSPFE